MSRRRVGVVTDSTAYLPAGLAQRYDVVVVPLQVTLGARSGADGIDVTPADVARYLAEPRARATTSQPSPAAFAEAYAACDADEIIAVHLSSRLSGTAAAARSAATQAGRSVQVVDSRSTAMGLGFAVLAAAEAAAGDADAADVAAAAEAAVRRTRTLFYVDTLEHLRRGGRIGHAAALVGTALSVKPILQVRDGEIAPLEKVRTASRAIARLEELIVAEAGDDEVDIAVHHLAAPDRASAVATRLRAAVPGLRTLYESEVGAVVGAHVGPGLLGVVVHHRG